MRLAKLARMLIQAMVEGGDIRERVPECSWPQRAPGSVFCSTALLLPDRSYSCYNKRNRHVSHCETGTFHS